MKEEKGKWKRERVKVKGLLLSIFIFQFSLCLAHNDSIYGGTQIKLDIASPILIPAANNWKMQNYEIAANVRLAKRFYPTLELGYSGGSTTKGDSINYTGHGGFFRVGCDLNPLKRHPESPHALLVGIRLGAGAQEFAQGLDGKGRSTGDLNGGNGYNVNVNGVRGDCWGEIVAGCQVEIAKVRKTKANSQKPTANSQQYTAFYMGWMGRFKALFTRTAKAHIASTLSQDNVDTSILMPVYIPGYGKRDNIGWGVNYYLGWRF